ncbi:Sugar kinase of the NBD/HSP70 family, may contain an N-terminal HTH domain [Lentzea xinjiangensis]|uniref:Sugar kinase of the NBD/HSP70 family, may contain an N-terminal HTH domain n=1 Tax=Lentzea xinjiangensis TaxID=402600 RepID=A0A1H9GYG5_9PSEU|nr:ROK family transcriptional regulator [Lentzea xinjiangensis]SEQ55085.1 Sugar kinase of the NBD/HSP70 family, may contain an N-terminal HTH domain [Lentzea xinjiangensis]
MTRTGSPRLLREINDRAAIETLLRSGAMTRAELEEVIGLSKPATAQLLARLEEDGMVVRTGLRGGGRGPRAQMWAVNGGVGHVAAVALTPELIDVAIADITGSLLAEHSAPMPKDNTLRAFRETVQKAAVLAGLRLDALSHVVVGTPGAVDPATGHLGFAPHLPGLVDVDLPSTLRELLGTSVSIENDINLAALEEMSSGKAVGVRNFVLFWPADEIGSAVVVNGVLLRGVTGGAGEIDSMQIPGGRYGDQVDNEAIMALAATHGIAASSGVEAVAHALSTGERAFLSDLARRIALGLANVVCVLDPELVLLSGSVAQAGGETLCDLVAAELLELVVPRTPVQLAQITANPVRSGALHSALAVAREQVFGLPQRS